MNSRRLLYSVLSAVLFLSGALLLFYFFRENGYIEIPVPAALSEDEIDFTYPDLPSKIDPSGTDPSGNGSDGTTNEFDPESNYNNPVDFNELKKTNNEIVGWIYMTSPAVNAPVLMSKKNDAYYLSHGPNGKYSKKGSFYIENTYNHPDFEDPVTIIYGHRKSDGSMFGSLQTALEKIDINKEPQYLVIYLPDSTKTYRIVATARHDSSHIMCYNNFKNKEGYDAFFSKIYSSKGKGVQLINDEQPQFGDRVLILSTCFKGDRTNRFLVIAKEL